MRLVQNPISSLVILLTLSGMNAAAQVRWLEEGRLLIDEPASYGGNFGVAVAVDGNTLAAVRSGYVPRGVYVFVRVNNIWDTEAYLNGADGGLVATGGTSLAIEGDTLVVGNMDDSSGGSHVGSVYVFVRTGNAWSQQAELMSSNPQTFSNFGQTVALSGDTIAVGAPFEDNAGGGNAGAVYVFRRTAGTWAQEARLTPTDAITDATFGYGIAISGDTLVAGAPFGYNTLAPGSAYLFVRSANSWSQQAKLIGANENEDYFGFSAAISGNSVAIGAPGESIAGAPYAGAAYSFVRSGTTWSQEARFRKGNDDVSPFEFFGWSIALDGSLLAIGGDIDDGNGNSGRGAAFLYSQSAGVWSFVEYLQGTDPDDAQGFGNSLDLSGDTLVVGEYLGGCKGNGATRVFRRYVPYSPSPCLGDLDGDNDVDLSDLAIVLSNYGKTCN